MVCVASANKSAGNGVGVGADYEISGVANKTSEMDGAVG